MVILPIAQVQKDQYELVGDKASSLAVLASNKFLSPEAFVLTSEAFQSFLDEHHLVSNIQSELAKVSIHDVHSLDYASRLLRDMVLGLPLPQDLETELLQQYKHINTDLVAVRSSIATSDEHPLAWTGVLQTFLRVSPDAIAESIKKCWASLFSPKPLSVIIQKGLSLDQIHLSVIVQRMIDSTVAGIAYSKHPINDDDNQMVIEAGLGIGNPSDKRLFTPDTYIFDKVRNKVIDKQIHQQEIEIIPAEGTGTTMKDLDSKKAQKQKLLDRQIKELADQIIKIESVFEQPVAVEWVLSGNEFYYLQARKMS